MRLRSVDNGQGRYRRFHFWAGKRLLGMDAPDIMRTIYYRPRLFGKHALRVAQAVMRGDSEWRARDRGLVAAVVSAENQWPFCTGAHGAGGAPALGEGLPQAGRTAWGPRPG